MPVMCYDGDHAESDNRAALATCGNGRCAECCAAACLGCGATCDGCGEPLTRGVCPGCHPEAWMDLQACAACGGEPAYFDLTDDGRELALCAIHHIADAEAVRP